MQACLKLELVWWFPSVKKALALKAKTLTPKPLLYTPLFFAQAL
ncbi:hypothetical protein HMPREF1427_01123 [Helicobacter pylori GAM83Bi]|nr:hypothetical protein HMPREF1427_01123 [Helicobacter pylori GAM83Bi]EMH37860.1 hypothetical protein HMPREF1428_01551 [Helicobacter pylori GAM83T]